MDPLTEASGTGDLATVNHMIRSKADLDGFNPVRFFSLLSFPLLPFISQDNRLSFEFQPPASSP